MTKTVRKCDFCGEEIMTTHNCRTVLTLKSHEDCTKPLTNIEFDICYICVAKMLANLHDKSKLGARKNERS